MGARVLIYLADDPSPQSVAAVQSVLAAAGASQAQRSHRELPGVWAAAVPDRVHLDRLISDLRAVPGVRHAEADQLRSTF